MHQYRPRITFDGWRDLIHFSKWLLLGNLSIFISYRSSTFILGKILGEHAVGIFSTSGDIAGIISNNLFMPLRRAIYPGYAKLATDVERLHDMFVDIFAVVFLVGGRSRWASALWQIRWSESRSANSGSAPFP